MKKEDFTLDICDRLNYNEQEGDSMSDIHCHVTVADSASGCSRMEIGKMSTEYFLHSPLSAVYSEFCVASSVTRDGRTFYIPAPEYTESTAFLRPLFSKVSLSICGAAELSGGFRCSLFRAGKRFGPAAVIRERLSVFRPVGNPSGPECHGAGAPAFNSRNSTYK